MKMDIDFKRVSFKNFEDMCGLDAYIIADELKKPEEIEEAKKKRIDKAQRIKKREMKPGLPRNSVKKQVKNKRSDANIDQDRTVSM